MNVHHFHASRGALVSTASIISLATVLGLVTRDLHVLMTLTNVKLTTPVILKQLVSTILVLISVTVNQDLLERTAMKILMTAEVVPARMEVCNKAHLNT